MKRFGFSYCIICVFIGDVGGLYIVITLTVGMSVLPLFILDWSKNTTGKGVDLKHIPVEELADLLTCFYCQPRPEMYEIHRKMLLDVRDAVNQHMIFHGRRVDVISDTLFKNANIVLEAILKEEIDPVSKFANQGKKEEKREDIQYYIKYIIGKEDLKKISIFLEGAASSPEILRLCVWYQIAMHFPTKSLDFYVQLKPNSFTFCSDEQGYYAELNHSPSLGEKYKFIEYKGKRMYATYEKTCPVSTLRLLLQKTPPRATNLFNQCQKGLTEHPTSVDIWYDHLPLAKGTIHRFLDNICKGAGIQKVYSPRCLWATAMHLHNVQALREGHDVSQHSIKNLTK